MLPYLTLFPFDGNSRAPAGTLPKPLAAPDRLPREVPPSNALESSTSTVPEGARREHQKSAPAASTITREDTKEIPATFKTGKVGLDAEEGEDDGEGVGRS